MAEVGRALVPLECPKGHRLPLRMDADMVARLPGLLASARCQQCGEVHEGRLVVRVVVGYTVLRLS